MEGRKRTKDKNEKGEKCGYLFAIVFMECMKHIFLYKKLEKKASNIT